ncbi:beta strand repeat-containing protein [Gluconobacter kondonii]|uniref:beta strand repeat-containing protein n=1 Tax=Gluconobacter kondonii TaxID=941463 RepID=UPI001B8CC576|nr:GLUG motif-containing protein [Gluconobacter kondonii]MBS1084513.1 filamentous hemagglutinin N-terminal domain-containing protein [Gluconobacter kondonii]
MTLTTRTLLLGITALTPGVAWGQALPTGGTYVAGSGSISTTVRTTTIDQSSSRGVINWQGFSIGPGASVRFNNGSGATLNRVTGAQSSSLLGHIGATGTLFLINPNGVVIGPGGTVVTGGSFVASTRDTPNSTFMKGGNVILSGSSAGTVTNAGKITSTSGNVVLVGASVSNKGTVSAAGGTAALLAGNQVVLSEVDGPSGIYIVADSKAKGNVTNTGRIRAAAATLASAGGNVYALAGNREGLVQATGTTRVNGQVWLSAPHGTVTVESTTLKATSADGSGGIIRANGRAVDFRGRAVLNASASKTGRKGGHILIGTDSMGGTNLARSTTLASGVTLKATGQGTGAGGTIETSAHTLAVGAATISAGPGGSWLLDPDDLTIDSNAASTINSALNSGTNVTEQTSAATNNIAGTGTSSAGNGDILLNAALSWNSAARLILSSYHSITLNADITVGGAGKLTLTTNNNIGGTGTGDGTLNFGTSSVRFTSSSLTAASTTSSSPLTIDGHSYTLITSPGDLQNAVGVSGYYALARPLDMSSISNFTPLTSSGFTGTFNGLGNTILNLVINSGAESVGLFGQVSTGGTIRNVGLIQANVTGSSGAVGSLAGVNDGTISDAYTTGNVTDTSNGKGISNARSSNSGSAVGGLVGVNEGTISDAYVTGNVIGSGVSDLGAVGGLVGLNNTAGTISNAYATGNVSSHNSDGEVGGLVGYNYYGTISNAYATGNVNASGTTGLPEAGGLVGYKYYGSISNAYATGNVTGSSPSEIGGLVGSNNGSISNAYATGNVTGSNVAAGGLIGVKYDGTISNVYATGHLTRNYIYEWVGALIGNNYYGTLNNAYFDTSTSGTTASIGGGNMSGGKGLTTVQWLTEGPMVSGSPYSFTDPGAWVSGSPYPILSALPHIVISSTGAQTYGQSAFSVSSLTFTDQNSNNASSLVDTSNLKWYSPLLSSTSNAGTTGAMYGTGATAKGYQITYQATDTVSKAALAITALNQTSIYGQSPTLNKADFKTSGLVNGDTVTGVSLSTAATNLSNTGSYALTASNARGSGLSNYAITYHNGTYDITRITTIPIFWPVASLNGNTPPASGPANLTITSIGQSPGLTLVNTYNPLPLPDSTANSAAPNTYQIVLPGTSYTNRLKDTF